MEQIDRLIDSLAAYREEYGLDVSALREAAEAAVRRMRLDPARRSRAIRRVREACGA